MWPGLTLNFWPYSIMKLYLFNLLVLYMTTPPLPVPLYERIPSEVKLASSRNPHRPASLPFPNATRSFWLNSEPGANPLAREGSEGPLTDDADICIIGSGITGISAAYHLSRYLAADENLRSMKVVILEARDFCSGATGRNGGHFTAIAFQHFCEAAALHGTHEALKGLALENHTITEILNILNDEDLHNEVDFVAGGSTNLLFTSEEHADLKADFEAAKQAGANVSAVKWFTKEEMLAQYGTPYPAFQYPGHNLWPSKLVTALYKLAHRTSMSSSDRFSLVLHTHTPVTFIAPSRKDSRLWELQTPRGGVDCTYVVHATNAYVSHLLPDMAGPNGIVPTRGQVVATRAGVSGERITTSAWTANEGFEYWFPRPLKGDDVNPLVLLGGGRNTATPDYELYTTDDSVVNPVVGATLRKFLPAVFPGKFEEGNEPDMEWTGIMGYTKLGDPFVGHVYEHSKYGGGEIKGQFLAAGYTGHGMPRAYACAEAVVQMILQELKGETWKVPEWLPLHYLNSARDFGPKQISV